ncbi:MAG: hypothetical protein ACT4PL_07060 [Phycisphaerales bacterium]
MKNTLSRLLAGTVFGAASLLATVGLAQTEAAKPAEAAATADAPTRVYLINLRGELGLDVTVTPFKAALKDARENKADVLVIRIDTAFSFNRKAVEEYRDDQAGQSFNQLETVRELETLFTDAIRDDASWKCNTPTGKPRLVMWVNKALGGSAFMPWVSPEIYFTSSGLLGGVGDMERMFRSGDFDPIMKQLSLRLARAKSLAEKGGYDPRLIEAMTWTSFVLSVSYVGGNPVYYESEQGDELLTDDGNGQAGRADTMEAIMRHQGNDALTLDAAKAYKLRISKGTVDRLEDLAAELDIARNYVEIKGKSDKIFKEWSEKATKAQAEFADLARELQRTPIEGNTPGDRNRGRAKQLSILNKLKDIVRKYRESINPAQLGSPDQIDSQLDLRIEQIKQQMRLDR